MGLIPDDVIEQVRARCDIVEVIQARVPLKRSGGAFKACCPFHKEKTPSFHVNPGRQIFHCFGCGVGGNVFRFIMDYDRVDFPTAVRMLAQQAGVTIPETESHGDGPKGPAKDDLLAVMTEAAALYAECLKKDPDAEAARAYLTRRDLNQKKTAEFGIGFAPDGPDFLLRKLAGPRRSRELLETAGLAMRNERGWYDRFRNRIMFSICDEQGRVIGFSGRVLRAEDSPAKYVNSPETPLFRKSNVLFGLHLARRDILDRRQAILCEGQIDVIRCHIAGLTNAVAAQGTAVTDEHARILKRYTEEVVLMMDADKAGQDAAIRSAEVLLGAGLVVRFAALPAGEDPDSIIQRSGPQPVQDAVTRAEGLVEFMARVQESRGEWASEAGRVRAVRDILRAIGWAKEPALREHLLQTASRRLGMTPDTLRRAAAESAATPRAQSLESETTPRKEATAPAPPEEKALVEALLHAPEVRPLVRNYWNPALIRHPELARMAEHLLDTKTPPTASIAALSPEHASFTRLATEIEMTERWALLADLDVDASPEEAVRDILLRLWSTEFDRRRRDALLRAGRATGEEKQRWTLRASELTLQMKTLRSGWDAASALLEMEAL